MKITIMKPVEVEVSFVNIVVPLRYDDADSMPKDFPLREGKFWSVSVEIETGRIVNWPKDLKGAYSVNEKVVDCGAYALNGPKGEKIAEIVENYVPNKLIPGEYGDYVELEILDGVITNWPKRITQETLSGFFPKSED